MGDAAGKSPVLNLGGKDTAKSQRSPVFLSSNSWDNSVVQKRKRVQSLKAVTSEPSCPNIGKEKAKKGNFVPEGDTPLLSEADPKMFTDFPLWPFWCVPCVPKVVLMFLLQCSTFGWTSHSDISLRRDSQAV